MYVHSDFKGNPTYNNSNLPCLPISLRERLKESTEVQPLQQLTTEENSDLHTEVLSKELVSSQRLSAAREATYVRF